MIPNMKQAPTTIDKSLAAVDSAVQSIDQIRVEMNKYWEKISLLVTYGPSSDIKLIEKEIDNLIESHEQTTFAFVRSINTAYAPSTRSNSKETYPYQYDKVLSTKKRNRERIALLQNNFAHQKDELNIVASYYPPLKKIYSETSYEIRNLEKVIRDWSESVKGEFQIFFKNLPALSGSSSLLDSSKSGSSLSARRNSTSSNLSTFQTNRRVLRSPLSSVSQCKSSSSKQQFCSYGDVEIKLTVKSMFAVALILTIEDRNAENSDFGDSEILNTMIAYPSNITYCSVSEMSNSSNIWNTPTQHAAFQVLSNISNQFLVNKKPNLMTILSHIRSYHDIFSLVCPGCKQCLNQDGNLGLIPPLFPIPTSTVGPAERRHYTCKLN